MIRRFANILHNHKIQKPITIVSGLPRSGTSMMMKSLISGGLIPLTDNFRTADIDNPRGYYEFERTKKLPNGDNEWLAIAQGKVVKIIASLLIYIPDKYQYRIVFMRRDISEILASQRLMILRRGEDPDKISNDQMARLFKTHLAQVDLWLANHPTINHVDVNYNHILQAPYPEMEKVNRFLGNTLDVSKMVDVIDPTLYRQRAQNY
jgi:hypothetical protein